MQSGFEFQPDTYLQNELEASLMNSLIVIQK